MEHDRDIAWPTLRVQAQVYNAQPGAIAFLEIIDVAGLFAFVGKADLISVLDEQIDAEGDDAAALTHEQRQQREAEARGDLLDVERRRSCADVVSAGARSAGRI